MSLSYREFSRNSLIMLLIIGVITLIGNWVGYGISPIEAAPGMAFIVIVGLVSLLLKQVLPFEFPAFAYAMIIAFLLSLPYSPVQSVVLSLTRPINFLATTTPILAYAGLSIGSQVTQLREVGWKLVVVGIFVFFGTFFGSALVAQAVMSIQGGI